MPVDIFSEAGTPPNYRDIHPFGRIPAFEHDGFRLYETGAIARYIDEAFQGRPLQATEAKLRARTNQLISIADNYAYPDLVWGVYVERVAKPLRDEPTDEQKLGGSLHKARLCLDAVSKLVGRKDWLAGNQLTLADLWFATMIDYFLLAPEGQEMFSDYVELTAWWDRMSARESMLSTKVP